MNSHRFIKWGTAALMLACVAPLAAQASDPLQRPVSLELRQVSVHDALKVIGEKAGLQLAFSSDVLPQRQVSFRFDDVSAVDALRHTLGDTGFRLVPLASGQFVLNVLPPPRTQKAAEPVMGVIMGQVTVAESGEPIVGASVSLQGTRLGALTNDRGRYTIQGVSAGEHTVTVRQIGYADARRSITVSDGSAITVDFALDVSALPLDELVVTGTAFQTRMRTVPNPINVITADEIAAKQATKLEDLLRGEIPGVMALSAGQRDFESAIYVRGNAGGSSSDLLKIYIDGVEVASPTLSTVDPESIERMEIVRGPQASAIYGSEAASGVLQIFTKHGNPGLDRPRLDIRVSTGVIESAYTPDHAGTPSKQDYSVSVSGGGEPFSYRAGVTYGSVGEWVNNYSAEALNISAGLRAVQGPITARLTGRLTNREMGWGFSPLFLRYPAGACPSCGNPDFVFNHLWDLNQTTMALTLDYQLTSRWEHSLTVGFDQNRAANHQPAPSLNTPADTFVSLSNQEFRRQQVRYHTAYDAPLNDRFSARVTAGADYWTYDSQRTNASNLLSAVGTVEATPNSRFTVNNDAWWNAGYYALAELGFQDQVYFTLAGRMESNPNLGEEYGRAFVPRAGLAYVGELGAAQVKLRGQWGRGVRAPIPDARTGRITASRIYLPNPAIAPEVKTGWDAGMDLFFGNSVSFSITRFDEEANNLIHREPVDLTATIPEYQFRNIGVVAIAGWELEGRAGLGPVEISANYAYSDTEVKEVDAETAANPNATLQVGDRTFTAPKHSGGGRITTQLARGAVSLDASLMSGWRQLDYVAYFGVLYAGEPARDSFRDYHVEYPALWKWNLRANQRLAERWSVFMRVENLMNNQRADYFNINVAPGRTTTLGVRWSL